MVKLFFVKFRFLYTATFLYVVVHGELAGMGVKTVYLRTSSKRGYLGEYTNMKL